MPLLPYATFDQAVEAATTAAPIALGGFPAIVAENRLFCQCLVTIESYGLNATLPTGQRPYTADGGSSLPDNAEAGKPFVDLVDALGGLSEPRPDTPEVEMSPWVLLLIQIVLAILDEWLNR